MEDDTKSADATPDSNTNAKGKKRKPTRTGDIGAAVLFFSVGAGVLIGWYHAEPLAAKVVLYFVASILTSWGSFALVDTLTPKANSNYAGSAMIFTWFGFLIYASSLTDINALRWSFIGLAVLFGLIAFIVLIAQANKDIRKSPVLRWVIGFLLVFVLPLLLASLLERPFMLCFIPFTFVLLYNEYLRTTYMTEPIAELQNAPEASGEASRFATPFRSLPMTLRGIRWPVYVLLTLFSLVFYWTITQDTSRTYDFSIFYQAVAPAYFGILAIVIAFAVLVIRRDTQQSITGHLRLAIIGLAKMYVVFALVNVVGLLMGTQVSARILTTSMELNDIIRSMDNTLHVLRLLILQFSISAFPVGLLYLYAMIRGFMSPKVGGSNHP